MSDVLQKREIERERERNTDRYESDSSDDQQFPGACSA